MDLDYVRVSHSMVYKLCEVQFQNYTTIMT